MNQWMRGLMTALVAGAILITSTASFPQNVVGPLGLGAGIYDPYGGYGLVWWQYRGGPRSTVNTDLYYVPPGYVAPGYDRYYPGEIVGPR
jgi:hypothetical protein